MTIAFDRGKVTLLDIPSYLTSRCKQTTAILGSVNALTAQYKKYISMLSDVDTSKVIIAEQLLGISKIIGTLSKKWKVMFPLIPSGKTKFWMSLPITTLFALMRLCLKRISTQWLHLWWSGMRIVKNCELLIVSAKFVDAKWRYMKFSQVPDQTIQLLT